MYKLDELIYRLILLTVFFPAFIFGYIQQAFAFDLNVTKENYSCGADNDCQTTNDNNNFSVNEDNIINYAIKYENTGQEDASGVYIIEKIASGSCYVVNSIESNLPEGGSVLYSTDDVPTFPAGGLRVIPSPDSNGTDCAITAFKLSLTNPIPPSSTIYIEDDESDFNGDASSTVITRDGSIKLQIPATFSQTTISAANTGFTGGVEVDDIDNDGDLDIIGAGNGGPSYIYFQTAPDTYNEVRISATSTLFVDGTVISDIDADGDKDLIMGGENYPTYVFLQGPAGTFTETQISAGNTNIGGKVKIIDIDNDGRLDIIGAGYNDKTKVFYQNANGTFTEQNISNTTTTFRGGIEVYDLDEDGDLDLVGGGYFGKTYWYKQTAARAYQEIALSNSNTAFLGGLVITDINNDANTLPDIAGGGFFGDSFIYKQTSQGTFSEVLLPGGATRFYSKPIVIDIEGDNDKDIVGGGYGRPTYLYSQNQSGNFQRSQISTDNTYFYSGLRSVDIDFDGDNDILGVGFNSHSFLYRNNNDGSFEEIQLTSVIANFIGNLEVIDINKDTHLDVVGGSDAGKSYYLINDGKLNFTQYELSGDTTYFKGGVEVADMDKDGDSDIVAGADGGRTYVFSNTSQYTSSGTYSVVIDSHGDVSAWDKLFASETIPSNTNIEYRIRDVVTDTCGSTDLIAYTVSTSGELDLSGINPSKDSICLTIKLTTTNVTLTPEVDMFNVTFTANSEKSFTYKTRTKSDLLSSSFGIVTSDVQIYPENGDTQLTNNRTASGLIIAKSEQSDLSILKTSYSCGADNNCSTLGDNDKTKVRENEIINYVVKFKNRGSAASEKTEIIDSIPDKTCYTTNSIESLIPSTFPSYKLYYSNDDRMTWVYKPTGSTVDCNVTDIKLQLLDPYKAKGEFDDFSDVEKGLIGYWKFDEENGNYAYDSTGNLDKGKITNLATNPSIETGTTGWSIATTGNGAISQSSTQKLYGNYSLRLTASTGNESDARTSYKFLSGKTYTVSAYFYLVNAAGGTPTLFVSTGYSQYLSSNLNTSLLNQWQRVSLTFTVGSTPGDGGYIDAARAIYTPSGTVDVYMDGLQIEETGTASPYCDGSIITTSLNGSWTETAHASSSTCSINNTAILTNGPTRTTGKIGGAISFDGTDDSIEISNPDLIKLGVDFSISVWIKTSDALGSIFGEFSTNGDNTRNFLLIASSGKVTFDQYPGSGTSLTSNSTVNNNSWKHIVYTQSGSKRKIYIDSVLDIGDTSAETYTGSGAVASRIGYRGSNQSGYAYSGLIDDLRIYDKELSQSDINTLFRRNNYFSSANTSIAPNDTDKGLMLQYKLDEGVGTSANDSSGNSYTGTLTSGPVWTLGKLGSAVNFDGADDFIATNATLGDTSITYTAWVNPSSVADDYDAVIGDWWYGATGGGKQFNLGLKAGKPYGHITYDASNLEVLGSDALPVGKWSHLALVYDMLTGKVKLYANGVMIGSGLYGGGVGTHSKTLQVGVWRAGLSAANSRYFNGKLDDVRVYNRNLSGDEIKNIYESGSSVMDLDNGLVGHWKMDETSWNGTTSEVKDDSGFGNHGTSVNSATTSLGKYGNAGIFNGSNYVSLGAGKFDTLQNASLSVWFNYTGSYDTNRVIFQRGTDGNSRQPIFISYPSAYGNKMIFENIVNGSFYTVTSNDVISSNTWNHLVVTCGLDGQKMYLNGSIQSSTNTTKNCFANIGSTTWSYIGQNFVGKLDDFRIYNKSLTPSEVNALYNYAPGPVAEWKFDEGLGTTIYDSSGTAQSGTLTNGPVWTSGKNNKAIYFDGVDDYVEIPNSSITDITSPNLTISAWIKRNSTKTDEKVVFKVPSSNDKGYGLGIYSQKFEFGIASVTCNIRGTAGGTILQKDVWYHLSATYDGINCKTYVNGILDKTSNGTGNPITTTANLRIGADQYASPPQYAFNGQIDDVKIYNYARTPAQIREDMYSSQNKTDFVSYDGKLTIDNNQFSTNFSNGGYNFGASDSKAFVGLPILSAEGKNNIFQTKSQSVFDGFDDYLVGGAKSIAGSVDVEATINPNSIIPNLQGDWWDKNWLYRRSVPITNTAAATITNQRVKIVLDTATLYAAGKIQNDCDDIRVTDTNGNLLNHWDTLCNTASSIVYVKIPTLPSTGTTLYLYYGNASATSIENTLGTTTYPGTSCKMMKDQGSVSANGLYYIVPGGNDADMIQVYCDMTTLSQGWTVALNSNRNVTPNPEPVWTDAINSMNITGTYGSDLNAFDLIMGLRHWNYVGTTALVEIGSNASTITKRATYSSISLNTSNFYALSLGTETLYLGAGTPGIKSYHAANNFKFTTSDADNDAWSGNCANNYGGSPWWYGGCWSGSFWGGGDGGGYQNAPFWDSSSTDYNDHGTIMLGGDDTLKNVTTGALGSEIRSDFPKSPISNWKLNEISGTIATDSTSNNNNGTLSGGPVWSSGKMNGGLQFDGIDDFINVSSAFFSNRFIDSADFTISAWIKPTALTAEYTTIVGQRFGDTMVFGIDTEGKLYLNMDDTRAGSPKSTSAVKLNQWQHVLVTFKGSDLSRVATYYIDGVQNGSAVSYDGNGSGSQTELYLGWQSRNDGGGANSYFKGYMDEVNIYDYVLTASEITKEMKLTRPEYTGGTILSKGENYELSTNPVSTNSWTMPYQTKSGFSTNAITTQLSGTAINDVFWYDTTLDTDYGTGKSTDPLVWRFDVSKSWYNETIDATYTGCNIATHDRCGTRFFPEKAYIVATNTNVYIFDAQENAMWMRFDIRPVSGPWTSQVILTVDGAAPKALFMLNGKMYIGNNLDFASYGLHVINFLNDTGKKYSVSDYASTYNGTISTRNNYTSYGWGGAGTGVTIVNSVVNDISVAVISEKTYIAVATDVGVSVINETNNTVINITETFSNWRQSHVFLANDDLYIVGQESTNAQGSTGIGAYYNINTITTNITTPENSNQYYWGQNYPWPVPSLLFSSIYNGGGPLVAGNKINDIYVTKGTSTIDGISNTIFLSSQIGTSILQEKQGDESNGSVKYITKDYVSEEMVGDIRGMWPFYGSGNIANNTYNIDDVSVKSSELTAKNTNGTGMAYADGVRGKGISFDGVDDYLCTDTNDDGTCDDNDNLDATFAFSQGAWIKTTSNSPNEQAVLSKFNGGVAGSHVLYLFEGTARGHVEIPPYTALATTPVNDGKWHHIVHTFDGATSKIYVDGVLEGTRVITGAIPNTTVPFMIGARLQASSPTAFFNGTIDEPFVTAETLTDAQIKNMYEIGRKALEEGSAKTSGATGSSSSTSLSAAASGLRRVGTSNYTSSTLLFSMGATGNILYEMDLGSDSIVSSNTVGNIAKIVPTSGGKNITATASGVRRVNDVSGKTAIIPNKDTTVRGYFSKLDGYYRLYEDGVEVGKTYVGQAHTPTANGEMFTIGSKSSGLYPGNFYNGTLKSVNVWKTDLTGTFEKIITPSNSISTWQNLVINSTLPPGTNIKYTIYGYNNGCNYSNILYGPSNAAGITNISTILPSNTTVCLRGNLTTNDYKTLPSLDSYELTHSSSTYDQIEFRSKVDLSMGMAGPIAHWKLDEGTGTSATDSSGNGKTGTLTNGPVWIDGKISKGLAFDGTDDYVNVTNLSLDSTITLSAWIRSSAYEGKIPLSINSDGFASGPNLFFWGGTVSWNTGDSGNNPFYTGAYPNSNWHHYAIVNDASANNAKLYIDGVFRGQAGYRNSTTTNGSFQIGRFHDGGYNINGLIDDVKIFSRALTASEIANIYNTNKIVNVAQITSSITDPITDNNTDTNVLPFDIPSPDLDITISGNSCGSENNCTLSTGLVGHWKFDRALAADNLHAIDSSTNKNHGTLVGSPAFVSNGKNDNAISLDGVDDRITASTISGLTAANTKAVWINPAQFTTGMNQYIIDMGGNNNWIQLYDHDNDGLPIIRAGFNGSNFVDTTLELPVTSRWYHIAIASTTTNIAIYVDGVLEASATKTSVSPGAITIGDYSSTGYRFKGLLDDLRLYNRTLNADEVRYLSQIARPFESIQYKADIDNINTINPRDFETINFIPDGTCYTVGSIENTLPNYVALSYSNDDIPTFGYIPIADSNGTDCFVTAYKIVYTDNSYGLINYWPMEENTWNSTLGEVNDNGSDNRDLTAYGGASINTSGKFGNTGNFDGVNDYLEHSDSPDLTSKFTISAWIKSANFSPTMYIFEVEHGRPLVQVLANKIAATLRDSANTTWMNYESPAVLNNNQWNHILVTYDNPSVKIYHNGILVGTGSHTGPIGGWSSGANTWIGGRSTVFFNGQIDEVKVFNKALTAEEAKSLYNQAPGPVAYYDFNEGTGSTINDKSGNSRNGTTTGSPSWAPGKSGTGLNIASSGQYASIPSLGNYVKSREITIEFWAKLNTVSGYQQALWLGNDTPDRINVHYSWTGTMYWDFGTCCTPRIALNPGHVASRWDHFTFVSSAQNGYMRIYKNGVQIGANAAPGTFTPANHTLYIGNTNAGTYPLNGVIDEFKIYNRALSDQEILRSYNNNLYSYDFKVKANPALTNLSQITNNISSEVDPDRNQIEIITSNNSSTNILDIKYPAIISGKVWNDRNNNGIQENGEPGINGTNLKIYLDNNSDGTPDGAALSTATTATDLTKGRGFYKFDNLNIANKYLIGLDPADTTQIAPKNTAPFNINNDFSNTTRLTDTITLTLIDNKDHIDLGLVGTKTISGYIWEDNDNSGSIDNEILTRHGIDAITINLYEDTNLDGLYGSGDGLYASTTSDENGAYSFGSLLSNKYIVVISEDSFGFGQPLHNCKSSDDQYPNVADHGRYTGDNITSGQIDLSTAPNATGINFGFLLGEKPAPWLTGWTYRVPISVQGNTVAVTDYQVSIDTNTQALVGANKLSSDCKDIRFTDSDMITPLNYWIDNGCNTSSTRIWTKIPSIPTEGKAIYMYYGNNNAVDQSNGVNTFEFFDDFSSGSLKAGWSTNDGTWTQASGVISQTNAASGEKRLIVGTTSNNIAIEASVRPDSFGGDYRMGVVGRMATQNGYNSTIYASSRSQLAILDDWITWGSPQNIGFTYNTGTWYKFRLAMYGNNQYAKSWALGSAEPANWQVTQAYTSKSANNAGLNGGLTSTATFDNFFVRKFINPQPGSGLGSESTYSNGGGSTPTPSPTPTPPVWDATSGLIAYWPLNEGTGTTTDDASINNYIGNLINGPTWLDGKFNKATSLDGSNDYINMGAAVAPSSNLTISAWIYPRNAENSTTWGGTIYNWGVTTGCNPSSQMFYIKSNTLQFNTGCGTVLSSAAGTIQNNQWYHVALGINTSGETTLYINGVTASSPTNTRSGQSVSTGNDKIGATHAGGTLGYYFNGNIDDIRIYNRVLDSQEINYLYSLIP